MNLIENGNIIVNSYSKAILINSLIIPETKMKYYNYNNNIKTAIVIKKLKEEGIVSENKIKNKFINFNTNEFIEKYSNILFFYIGIGKIFDKLKLKLNPFLIDKIFMENLINKSYTKIKKNFNLIIFEEHNNIDTLIKLYPDNLRYLNMNIEINTILKNDLYINEFKKLIKDYNVFLKYKLLEFKVRKYIQENIDRIHFNKNQIKILKKEAIKHILNSLEKNEYKEIINIKTFSIKRNIYITEIRKILKDIKELLNKNIKKEEIYSKIDKIMTI